MKKLILSLAVMLCSSLTYAQEYETIIEEFTDNSGGWLIQNDDNYRTVFKDGLFHFENLSSSFQNSGKIIPIDLHYDFTIEAKLKRSSDSDLKSKSTFFGFIVGNTRDKNFLMFVLNGEKKIAIARSTNGESERMVPPEINNAVKPDDYNILSIEKKENVVKYLINGEVVYQGNNINHGGVEFYFCSFNNVKIDIDYLKISRRIMKIKLVDNPINGYKLENLGEKVNSPYTELLPVISPDGGTLFLVRSHPDNINGKDRQEIWSSEKSTDGTWNPAINFGKPFNNSGYSGVISVTPDGNSILLKGTYDSNGEMTGNGVSISKKREGKWQNPENQEIENFVNEANTIGYCLSPDGIRMIMSLRNSKVSDNQDLYICSLLEDGKWSEPQNMGNVVNSFATEFAPFIAADGKTLYFSSYGHPGYGDADIFFSHRLDDTWLNWSEPLNLGPEINSSGFDAYFTLPAQGDYAYMVSSNPAISLGGEDIFRIKLPKSASIDPVVMVSGYVYNKKTNKIINAQISYENLTTGKEVGRAFSTVENGYKIALPKGSVYGYRAQADSFVSVNENLDLSKLEIYAEKKMNLYLVPIERGQTIRLNNIFFDYDKIELKEESIPELNRLIVLMKQNPAMRIEITGHTDNMGTNEYNFKLAGDRAIAVKNYVIANGIDKTRVSSKSYGETKPVATNETEEGRQQNRRVEFVIL
jgi:outer membrane protein OmpA-like peptidoglycan-associated protein